MMRWSTREALRKQVVELQDKLKDADEHLGIICKQNEEFADVIEHFRTALEFYADELNYDLPVGHNFKRNSPVIEDGGKRAKEILGDE